MATCSSRTTIQCDHHTSIKSMSAERPARLQWFTLIIDWSLNSLYFHRSSPDIWSVFQRCILLLVHHQSMIKPQISISGWEMLNLSRSKACVLLTGTVMNCSQIRNRVKWEKSPARSKQQGWRVFLMSETIRNAQPQKIQSLWLRVESLWVPFVNCSQTEKWVKWKGSPARSKQKGWRADSGCGISLRQRSPPFRGSIEALIFNPTLSSPT